MYTLEDIYNRLATGAPGTKRPGGFEQPAAAATDVTGRTLNEVMEKAPVADGTNAAVDEHVLSGKTIWGLDTAAWGVVTGTMPNVGRQDITPGTSAQAITRGYHDGTGTVSGDANLVGGNIKKDVSIFGVTGTLERGGRVGVPRTGQTPTSPLNPAPAGSDGALQKGVLWPAPRFTDNGNGTVSDNMTKLIWLKNADCFGEKNWSQALSAANSLSTGQCDLTDGSTSGNWRLPNVRELESLIDYSQAFPALPDSHPFGDTLPQHYWSSTIVSYSPTTHRYHVYISSGSTASYGQTNPSHVWPVR